MIAVDFGPTDSLLGWALGKSVGQRESEAMDEQDFEDALMREVDGAEKAQEEEPAEEGAQAAEDEGQPPIAEQTFMCSMCEEDLPLSEFPTRKGKRVGNVCDVDQLCIEGLQRQFKEEWEENYKAKWQKLRKDKQEFRERVLTYRANNEGKKGRGIRKVKAENRQMVHRHSKIKAKNRRRRKKMMTWGRFSDWYQSAEGGSHDMKQTQDEWKSFHRDNRKRDNKGEWKGERNQVRFRVDGQHIVLRVW